MPELFYIITNGTNVLLPSKIVDRILVTGEKHAVNKFLNGFTSNF